MHECKDLRNDHRNRAGRDLALAGRRSGTLVPDTGISGLPPRVGTRESAGSDQSPPASRKLISARTGKGVALWRTGTLVVGAQEARLRSRGDQPCLPGVACTWG